MSERRRPDRIDHPSIVQLMPLLSGNRYEKAFFAEGDSWFDIFTPAPHHEPNLLGRLETPWDALVVDTSHIGDLAGQMASGWQAANTRRLLDFFRFDAILLSAGGNDLRSAFTAEVDDLLARGAARSASDTKRLEDLLRRPAANSTAIDVVVAQIGNWIGLRDGSRMNADTPVLLHGYDYLQPRPAGPRLTVHGPTLEPRNGWLFPLLAEAGLDARQMFEAVVEVIDALNAKLSELASQRANLHFIDCRGMLEPAEPGTRGESNDWIDEIHPTPTGMAKLAGRWAETLKAVLAVR